MLSIGLVATWVYHLADKTRYSKQRKEIYIKDSLAVAQGVEDSLQRIYSLTLNELGTQLDSTRTKAGMLRSELNEKLSEIYRLRAEIAGILKRNNIKKTDIDLARKKTIELQMLVNELQNRNSTIEEEKQEVTTMLDKVNLQVRTLENTNLQLDQENKRLTEKASQATALYSSGVRISAVMVKNNKEQETSAVRKTSKLVISFDVLNNFTDYESTEVYVVITQPDGKLLSTDAWESAGTVETKSDGKIRYTRIIRFDYQKGESKHLNFSINAEEYQAGTYLLELYHNGYKIGQAKKVLS